MACRVKRDGDAILLKRLAIADGLPACRKARAVAQFHDIERLPRRQDMSMSGAGVVRMAMRDHGPLHRAHGIDVEIAGRAIKPRRARLEQVLRLHGLRR